MAVQPGADFEGLGVGDERRGDDARAVGRPGVEALAERPLAAAVLQLPVAVRDVVADGVAEDVVQGAGFGDVGARAADYGDEFAFVVEAGAALGEGVDGDGVGGAGEGGYGFVLVMMLGCVWWEWRGGERGGAYE